MAEMMMLQQHQPSFSLLTSSLSDFNGAKLHLQYNKRKVYQPKGALSVSASGEKKILIMGGTRFIGVFLSRLLVKEGHQVTLFTRGKIPIAKQLPGESDQDFADFSSKILHLKGDRKDYDFVKSSLSAEGFDVVYDINELGSGSTCPASHKARRLSAHFCKHATRPAKTCITNFNPQPAPLKPAGPAVNPRVKKGSKNPQKNPQNDPPNTNPHQPAKPATKTRKNLLRRRRFHRPSSRYPCPIVLQIFLENKNELQKTKPSTSWSMVMPDGSANISGK